MKGIVYFFYDDRSEWHEFVSRFLCAVGKQRRTENTGICSFIIYLF